MTIFKWIGELFSEDAAHNARLEREGKVDRSNVKGLDPQRGMSEDELREYAKKSEQEKHGFRQIKRRD